MLYLRRSCSALLQGTGVRQGGAGLMLLLDEARRQDISVIYDNIAPDNPAIRLFRRCGFRRNMEKRRLSSCWKKRLVKSRFAQTAQRPSLTADGRTEPAKRGGFLKRKPPLLQPMEKIASGIQQVCIRPFESHGAGARCALGGELSSSAAAGAVFALDHPLFTGGKTLFAQDFGNAISLTGEKGRPFVRKAAPLFRVCFYLESLA